MPTDTTPTPTPTPKPFTTTPAAPRAHRDSVPQTTMRVTKRNGTSEPVDLGEVTLDAAF